MDTVAGLFLNTEPFMDQMAKQDAMKMLSCAVQRWYLHYAVEYNDRTSDVLCRAAIALFDDGHRSEDEIVTILIGRYIGRCHVIRSLTVEG